MLRARFSGPKAIAAGTLVLAGGLASSQPVYRTVGPDGRVTFSDRPPATGTVTTTAPGRQAAPPSGPALPFELQQTAARFPVTLYTGPECAPCDSGRALLAARGVPFSERTVRTNDDIAALQRLTGDSSLPVATIGAQRLMGYSPGEWTQYLDSAGYPQSSQLPSGYRRPPALPLVGERSTSPASAASSAPAPTAAGSAAPADSPPAAARPQPANPSGITF